MCAKILQISLGFLNESEKNFFVKGYKKTNPASARLVFNRKP